MTDEDDPLSLIRTQLRAIANAAETPEAMVAIETHIRFLDAFRAGPILHPADLLLAAYGSITDLDRALAELRPVWEALPSSEPTPLTLDVGRLQRRLLPHPTLHDGLLADRPLRRVFTMILDSCEDLERAVLRTLQEPVPEAHRETLDALPDALTQAADALHHARAELPDTGDQVGVARLLPPCEHLAGLAWHTLLLAAYTPPQPAPGQATPYTELLRAARRVATLLAELVGPPLSAPR
ncbi:hypothetical protein GKE82_24450 [Conexibacter sp. W3-3-2]|uniref:hypothetical protein n=1 Tax=Conexibacter sp. W3-3-2 TaxID=2675227 RepID=UPI0012B912B8|nr:hypothetical protein [Conexibacter sp. W3-3-2]MTD47361.1 hypothetical protein [Conexibacter sp. W3-3-2]